MMSAVRAFVPETFRRNRLLASVAAAHVALVIVLLPLSVLDPTQLLGISRWVKPMKFAMSIAIYLGTMAWLLSYLRDGSPRAVRTVSRIFAFTMGAEIILILIQAARGVQSHFNQDSAIDGAIFSAMGLLIVVNTVAVMYALYLFHRRPVTTSGAHLAGIRFGVLLFVLASLEGGLMILRNSHGVGVPDGGPGLPLVNWSTAAGDLRVAHFVGMHALQGLPILGWLLDQRPSPGGARWVGIVAMLWAVVTGLLVAQAMAGRPLLALMP